VPRGSSGREAGRTRRANAAADSRADSAARLRSAAPEAGHAARIVNKIGDYALIGDCYSSALAGRDGSIDWACFPRFDSPSVFGRVLDAERGGSFAVTPRNVSEITRSYVDGTNVLETTFHCGDGVLVLTDCMPATGDGREPTQIRNHRSILR